MKTYRKEIKHSVNQWSGYTKEVAFNIELECYTRLQSHKNFPRIVSVDTINQSIELEYCGESLDTLMQSHNSIELLIPDLAEQLHTIWDSLEKEDIKHLDVQLKNFTFKDGILYLIDFDIALIDSELKTDEIKSLFTKNTTHLGRITPDTGDRDSVVYLSDKDYFTFYFLNLIRKGITNHVQNEPYQIIDTSGGWRDCNQRWVHIEKYVTNNPKNISLDVGSAEGFFSKKIQNKTDGVVYSIEGSAYPYKRQLKYNQSEIKNGSIHLMNFYLDSKNIDILIDTKYNYTLLLSVLHWVDNPDYILQTLSTVSEYMFIEVPSLDDNVTINKKYMEHIKKNYQSIDNYLEFMTDKKILEKIDVPAHTSKSRTLYIIS
jgi:hypothetical protein